MLALHIGLPKTGTTFLQSRVFERTPDLQFIHRSRAPGKAGLCWAFRRFARASAPFAVLRGLALVRRLNAMAAAGPEGAGPRRILLSDENISVIADDFWRSGGTGPDRLALRLAALGRRLGGDLSPIRVIIGIRRQDRWLASRYAESSRFFPAFGQADFDRRMAQIAASDALPGPLGWLDHHAVRAAFVGALGQDNVFLLPLERLAEAEGAILAALGDFLDAPALRRKGRRPKKQPRARRPNQLSEGDDVWRLRRDGSLLRLEPEIQAALLARFAASNAALAAAMPLGFGA